MEKWKSAEKWKKRSQHVYHRPAQRSGRELLSYPPKLRSLIVRQGMTAPEGRLDNAGVFLCAFRGWLPFAACEARGTFLHGGVKLGIEFLWKCVIIVYGGMIDLMRKFASLAFLLVLLTTGAALAQDVCTIENPADGGEFTTDCDYITIGQALTGSEAVSLTIDGPSGTVYQRDYGTVDDYFASEEIYLPLDGTGTRYDVTLEEDASVTTSFTVYRITGRLTDITASSAGLPLRTLSGADTWRTATLLDLRALEGNSMQVPVCAGDAYTFGYATFSVSGGSLYVTFQPEDGINPEISRTSLSVALTAEEAAQLGKRGFSGIRSDLGSWIPLNGAAYAAVYLRMTVSMDPSAAPCTAVDDSQWTLWERMQTSEPAYDTAADELPDLPEAGDAMSDTSSRENPDPSEKLWNDPVQETNSDAQTDYYDDDGSTDSGTWVEP